MIGIYKITSPSGRVYIGQSIDIEKRFRNYKYSICSKEQPILHNSFKKYGWESHIFEVVFECEISELNKFERHYQELYQCISERGMNCKLTNTTDKTGVLSESTKQKMSKARKGKKLSQERIEKLKLRDHSYLIKYGAENGFYGRSHSVESKLKISNKNKGHSRNIGRKASEETKIKISKANTGNRSCLGREMSEETRNKIRKSLFKIVIDSVTGEEFESINQVCEIRGLKINTLRKRLLGSLVNNTNLKYK